MVLWRISRHLDLSGAGGLRAPGRWHHTGHPIVYLAGSPAAALLEVCVHTSANDVPPAFTLLKISAPDTATVARIDLGLLPDDWTIRQELTRDLGTEWLNRKNSPALEVPSAIVPETFNTLLNPLHREAAEFAIVSSLSYPFDPRIKV